MLPCLSTLSRQLRSLIAVLVLVAGVGLPATKILCVADDHVAVESAAAMGGCDGNRIQSTASLEDADDCVDVLLSTRAVSDAATTLSKLIPLPLTAALIGTLDEPVDAGRALAGPPRERQSPPHLLPLRSFVLLT